MDFEIVVIDDNMAEKDPFVRTLQKTFKNSSISVYTKAEEGAKYVIENCNKKIIVFLDCGFTEGIQGIDALKKIREKTSLVYIVMMSAIPVNQLTIDEIDWMINHRGVFFIDNKDTDKAILFVNRITNLMQTKIDCVLEQWVLDHPEESQDRSFVVVGDKSYTLKDMLHEIRSQSEFGRDLENKLLNLTIHLLTRGKKNIND